VRGPRDALVTIVEFGDFECQFCARVEPTLRRLRERFGNDVRLVWKNAPIRSHPHAMPCAEAAMEVQAQLGDEAFWRFHDALFANPSALEREDLERYAADAGADMERFRASLDAHARHDAILGDLRMAERLGVDGTPYFLINGTAVVGAKSFELFADVVSRVLDRARSVRPRERAYADMSAAPLAPPVPVAPPAPRANAAPQADGDRRYAVRDATHSPSRGATNARVVVQMFADFQCPFCGDVNPTLDALLARHPLDVRLVWRDYPLGMHANAELAAEAAREAFAQQGDAGFWRFHDVLFANQSQLARADLDRYARNAGLDPTRFRNALDQHTHQAEVQADVDAGDASGAEMGTPAFFVNGRLVVGAADLDEFERVVQAALAEPTHAP
jgi:protein-disulfide isomerase